MYSGVIVLGVTISSSLSVSQHVTNVVNSVHKRYMHYALCERTAWMTAPCTWYIGQ